MFIFFAEPPTYPNPNTRQWFQGSVTFDVASSGTMMFDGVRGNGYYGDVAIDDISIKQCVSGNYLLDFFF